MVHDPAQGLVWVFDFFLAQDFKVILKFITWTLTHKTSQVKFLEPLLLMPWPLTTEKGTF